MTKALEIFKTGTHVGVNGIPTSFTREDVRGIQEIYDPNLLAAPLVIGHPASDDPAHGWVDALHMEGDSLYATPRSVSDALREGVRQERYLYISISLFFPNQAGNPTPGRYYLRHVGFLGARSPAVTGMAKAEFSLGGGSLCCPPLLISPTCKECFTMSPEQITKAAKALNARAAQLEAKEKALEAKQLQFASQTYDGFTKKLVEEGKLRNDEKPRVDALFGVLAKEEPLQFASPDGDLSKSPTGILQELLEQRPPLADFGEYSAPDVAVTMLPAATREFAGADKADLALHKQILAFQNANEGMSYTTALETVIASSALG
uniref:Mu-like prophage I protein n=1 Tax=Candidatus Kentrum sp. UNK TaxID=2126344 RepID=A0A450ZWP9_9GAMM|nr:MAG: hypothetical protein BECKUNK1418G_GA0071005_100246 [Candidatus Kentron sp. UNK]VFK68312.1 MAG: hypothetical protein BECKUNK1418H_GA0071006_100146 [Candidatus Kentron sp. UNK]